MTIQTLGKTCKCQNFIIAFCSQPLKWHSLLYMEVDELRILDGREQEQLQSMGLDNRIEPFTALSPGRISPTWWFVDTESMPICLGVLCKLVEMTSLVIMAFYEVSINRMVIRTNNFHQFVGLLAYYSSYFLRCAACPPKIQFIDARLGPVQHQVVCWMFLTFFLFFLEILTPRHSLQLPIPSS